MRFKQILPLARSQPEISGLLVQIYIQSFQRSGALGISFWNVIHVRHRGSELILLSYSFMGVFEQDVDTEICNQACWLCWVINFCDSPHRRHLRMSRHVSRNDQLLATIAQLKIWSFESLNLVYKWSIYLSLQISVKLVVCAIMIKKRDLDFVNPFLRQKVDAGLNPLS